MEVRMKKFHMCGFLRLADIVRHLEIANGDDNGAIECDRFKPLDGFISRN